VRALFAENKVRFARAEQPWLTTAMVAVWLSGNTDGHINEVTLRRAGLVLRWVTVHGNTILVFNQATQANSACG